MGKKYDKYIKVLESYFNGNGINVSKDEIKRIGIGLENLGEQTYSSSEDNCYYYLIKPNFSNITAKRIISMFPDDIKDRSSCKILFLVDNIQDKFKINESQFKKELKIELTQKLSLKKRIKSIIDITAEFIGKTKRKHEIEISDRVDSLKYCATRNNVTRRGYAYIASLLDIVKMYNLIGDPLFDLNVRYRISDELDVEKEISKTLDNNPQDFWFKNNGITIIVNSDKFKCERPRTIEFIGSSDFFIINGAQTITTAAKWYYNKGNNNDKLKEAKVLLRVILVDDIAESFARDVSVCLNRQKSISEIDITTTYKFVEDINLTMNECNDENICFEINKRGGTPTYKHSYYVDDFAQIVEAYMIQKPGSARSSKGALISSKENKGEYSFFRTDIFKNINSADDIQRYYSPLNFAYDLLDSYKEIAREYTDSNLIKDAILRYGNMYCIASIIFCMNNKKTSDFSSFKYSDAKHNIELIDKFIECFESFVNSIGRTSLDSNDFKKEELYNKFKSSNHFKELSQFISAIN